MKPTLAIIAKATAALLSEHRPTEHGKIFDAAVLYFHERGMYKALRFFPRTLLQEIHKRTATLEAELRIPTIPTATEVDAVSSALREITGQSVDVRIITDPSLLGGASLALGDERIDLSIKSLLQKLHAHLRLSSFSVSTV